MDTMNCHIMPPIIRNQKEKPNRMVPTSAIVGVTTNARIGMGTATTAQIVSIFARLY